MTQILLNHDPNAPHERNLDTMSRKKQPETASATSPARAPEPAPERAAERKGSKRFTPLLRSYPDSEKINAISEGAECLYLRLLVASDDDNRYFGDPVFILSRLFTHRFANHQVDAPEIERRLDELEAVGLISRYWRAGKRYLTMVAYKITRRDIAPDNRFPAPDPVPGPVTGPVTETVAGTNPDRTCYEAGPDPLRTRDESGPELGQDRNDSPERAGPGPAQTCDESGPLKECNVKECKGMESKAEFPPRNSAGESFSDSLSENSEPPEEAPSDATSATAPNAQYPGSDFAFRVTSEDGAGVTWVMPQMTLAKLIAHFPLVDVPAQLARARAWLEKNPEKRRPASQMPEFIQAWLERDIKPKPAPAAAPAPPASGAKSWLEKKQLENKQREAK